MPSIVKAAIAPEVQGFCRRVGVEQYLPRALALIEESFPSASGVDLEVVNDPETREEWVALGVAVAGDTEETLDAYDAYTDRWVAEVPWPQRSKIRLFYYMK